jgi:hypothetical protein
VQRAAVVDLHVDERVRDRRHDRDLRGEMRDPLDPAVARGDRRERREDAVRDIAMDELDRRLRTVERVLWHQPAREVGAPPGAQVVEHHHAMAELDELVDEMRADEAGTAGDDRDRMCHRAHCTC